MKWQHLLLSLITILFTSSYSITLSLFIPMVTFSKETAELSENDFLDNYYNKLFTGEKRLNNYHGPRDPSSFFNEARGELLLLDDQFSNHFFDKQIQTEVFDLHSFWIDKVVDKSACPDVALGENLDYIRYLYRLLTISYLFESLKINNKISSELGFEKKQCSLSFDEVFGKCTPVTEDMKKFKERIQGKFLNEFSKYNVEKLNKKETLDWLSRFKKSTSLTVDSAYAGLHDWCHQEGRNCRSLSLNDIKKALGNICDQNRLIIQNLCSEKDDLQGASYLENATELIQSSNAFNLINLNGMGEDCLHRYVKVFTPKEFRYDFLSHQLPLIYSHLTHGHQSYLQGELFLPGALKEFDIKGLSDFLIALRPPPKKISINIVPLKKNPIKISLPEKIPFVVKPVEVLKPEVIPMKITEPFVVKLSEFEKSVLLVDDKKNKNIYLDMEKFKNDFDFSSELTSELLLPISRFQTRAALNDMKIYDSLGSISAPVGLIFLKYLIDTENHQGLFNMTTILGEKFYVVNDIEKKERAIYIYLLNDASTKNKWQIILMPPPGK